MPLYLGLFDRGQFPSPPNPTILPRRPSRKITDAGGMSVRTKVARRTLSRFRPKAPKAIDAAAAPKAAIAARNKMVVSTTAVKNEGSRHAISTTAWV